MLITGTAARGETDKGEANDGVDPLKGSDEIPRQYSILRILFGNFGTQGERDGFSVSQCSVLMRLIGRSTTCHWGVTKPTLPTLSTKTTTILLDDI